MSDGFIALLFGMTIQVPDSGHYIPEERPDFLIKMLENFTFY